MNEHEQILQALKLFVDKLKELEEIRINREMGLYSVHNGETILSPKICEDLGLYEQTL
jgi:hypothetical protein